MPEQPQEWHTPTLTRMSVNLDTAISNSGSADAKNGTSPTV